TVVIGPEGKTRAAFPLFQATSAVLHVPVYPVVRTYYARMRDWVIVLCALIFFAEGVRMAVHTRRHSTTQAESSLQQIRGEHV
ncbi:apolipoprotein N-acyltransferase, partial [Treponema pallidum]